MRLSPNKPKDYFSQTFQQQYSCAIISGHADTTDDDNSIAVKGCVLVNGHSNIYAASCVHELPTYF